MLKSTFHIAKMDCPSEERIIKLKLDGIQGIKKLEFDLEKRELIVYHSNPDKEIDARLSELKLGSKLIKTIQIDDNRFVNKTESKQSKVLLIVLVINFSFFVIELGTGFISNSMGLIADSLDMLADSFVYILSLLAVGSTLSRKKKVAKISGYFQLLLAALGFTEVIRRFISFNELPDYKLMITISVFALIANAICLYLLQKHKSEEAHMKASMIFTSNDVIINAGVILAGIFVFLTNSKYPDLIIGSIVFYIVVRGAFRILKLSK